MIPFPAKVPYDYESRKKYIDVPFPEVEYRERLKAIRKMMQAQPAQTDFDKESYSTTRSTIKMLSENAVTPGFEEFLEERKDLQPTY